VTFTLAYVVFAVCFVFTPTEFHSAGLTVQNLLSGWLGSEDAAFVPYHLRRTAATLLCHSLLPLGYYVGMCFAASEKRLYSPSQAPETWRVFLLLALTLPTIACTLIYYWSRDRWAHHPLARTLAHYAFPQLNSTEYGELCEKLRAPIRSAANVVIHQSLGDLFLETFASLVEDLEACIGCMQTRASVRLVKTCQEADEGECQQC
ncbi:hypothetical protein E2I00_008821, partial [Balaenoptera physalus]